GIGHAAQHYGLEFLVYGVHRQHAGDSRRFPQEYRKSNAGRERCNVLLQVSGRFGTPPGTPSQQHKHSRPNSPTSQLQMLKAILCWRTQPPATLEHSANGGSKGRPTSVSTSTWSSVPG